MKRFSKREGYARSPDIKYRAELPIRLREPLFKILQQAVGGRTLLERLTVLLNPYGIDELPYHRDAISIAKEEDSTETIAAMRIFFACNWYQLYDLIEDIIGQLDFYEELNRHPDEELRAYRLRNDINDYFIHTGIGWKISGDEIAARGDDAFEKTIVSAETALQAAQLTSPAKHLDESLNALSRRPEPNLSGAVFHALGALEAVARNATGQPKATLGEIMKRQRGAIPKPLDKAITHIWGYASENARHVREGVEPSLEEATLIVSTSAAIIAYLATKY